MTQVPAAARTLARHVLTHEAGGSQEPTVLVEAAERVETRLRERLIELIGLIGYSTLLARALRLAQAESPVLEHITVNTEEGGLRGISDFVEVAGTSIDDPYAADGPGRADG